jgi:hypothetical protein
MQSGKTDPRSRHAAAQPAAKDYLRLAQYAAQSLHAAYPGRRTFNAGLRAILVAVTVSTALAGCGVFCGGAGGSGGGFAAGCGAGVRF